MEPGVMSKQQRRAIKKAEIKGFTVEQKLKDSLANVELNQIKKPTDPAPVLEEVSPISVQEIESDEEFQVVPEKTVDLNNIAYAQRRPEGYYAERKHPITLGISTANYRRAGRNDEGMDPW